MKKRTLVGALVLVSSIGCSDGDDSDGNAGNEAVGPDRRVSHDEPTPGAAGSGGAVSSAVPAVCMTDTDCGGVVRCVIAAGDAAGFCDVADMVAAGDEAPDSAEGADEAPDGTDEAPDSAGNSGPVDLAAPAMCATDDDCPAGVSCTATPDGGAGFCAVEEMRVED